MFTGLIEATGKIASVKQSSKGWEIKIDAPPHIARRLKTGHSVSVSGVCLTALNITKKSFEADLAEETVAKTSLSRLRAGSMVNLELPRQAGTPLGGHIVQGHVDGVAKLLSLEKVPRGQDWRLRLALPDALAQDVVNKGSITVEGISLTVAKIDGANVDTAIIPHTYKATNIHQLKPGALLNIEVDVLAKYAEKRVSASRSSNITVEKLLSEGF